MGVEVDVARDGGQAIEIATAKRPDLILLDIDLPVLHGFEVLKELKRRNIATRVFMLSGYFVDTDTAIKAIKAGACDYLPKPVDAGKLIERLKKALITESTLNVRMESEVAPLVLELFKRVERSARQKLNSDAADVAAQAATAAPSGFQEKLSKHWLIVSLGGAAAVAAITWQACIALYVQPRDFEIERLRRAVEGTSQELARPAEPASAAPSTDSPSPTPLSTPN